MNNKKLVKVMMPVEVLAQTDALLGIARQAALMDKRRPPDRSEFIVGVLRGEYARRRANR